MLPTEEETPYNTQETPQFTSEVNVEETEVKQEGGNVQENNEDLTTTPPSDRLNLDWGMVFTFFK